jgi:nucleobase:cation symporter-1, NCS1 family
MLNKPPDWGIEPVPERERKLGFLDFFVLWGSLGAGLLVMLAGTLLVPGLGLGAAFAAIVVGTLLGNLLLLVPAVVGSDHGVPTMVALRPTLGIRGSYLPSFVNVVQLVGWTAFELIIMATAASAVTERVLGVSLYGLWLPVLALLCTVLAIGGPLVVVRVWLEKFGIWLLLATTAYLTYYLLAHYSLGDLIAQPGSGDLPFPLAVDLVVALPLSWLPLAADYNRFARNTREASLGTYLGFLVTNVWFFALGAVAVLALQTEDLIASIMALTIGGVALIIILVDETDNAFADIYSAAVSTRNFLSGVTHWKLTIFFGVLGFVAAVLLPMESYEAFLLLLGSLFAPLFGIVAADYFLLRRRRMDVESLYDKTGAYGYHGGFNGYALFCWVVGVAIYQGIAYLYPSIGASLPSFVLAGAIYLGLARLRKTPPGAASETD